MFSLRQTKETGFPNRGRATGATHLYLSRCWGPELGTAAEKACGLFPCVSPELCQAYVPSRRLESSLGLGIRRKKEPS